MVTITKNGLNILDWQVSDLEKVISCNLPEDYREFLITYNGGQPNPNVIDISDSDFICTDVQIIFGIEREIKTSTLEYNLSFMYEIDGISDFIANKKLLPIACDSGGNLYFLYIVNSEIAKVIYCDMQNYEYVFYDVAESFTDFLNKLRS